MGVYITNATVKQVMKVLMNSTEWLPDKAEIIEISTPHGRLIDVDAINYRHDKLHHASEEFVNGIAYIHDRIEETPTMIESEVE